MTREAAMRVAREEADLFAETYDDDNHEHRVTHRRLIDAWIAQCREEWAHERIDRRKLSNR